MTASLDDLIAQRALATATPATIPLVQRSAYLADALRQLQETGGQNIRSPWQLGANLLAEAITQHSRGQANQQLAGQQQKDLQSLRDIYMGPLQDGGAGATPAANAAPPAASQPPPANPVPPQGAAPPMAPSAPIETQPIPPAAARPPMSDADKLALAQEIYGEARGEPVAGQRAVASVAMNRAVQSGKSLADVISAPHQFSGYNAQSRALGLNDPRLAGILQNAQPLIDGSMSPTTNADHFYAPQGMPNGAKPAWDNGTGQQIGNQLFFRLNGGAPPQASPQGPVPAPAPQMLPQAMQAPPMAPQGPPGGMQAPPPPMSQGMPQNAGPSPQVGAPPAAIPPTSAAGGIPTGPGPTPQESMLLRQLMSDPRTMQQGMELALKLRERQATPMAAPEKMMWGPNGQAVPIPGTQTTQLPGQTPSDAVQRDAFGAVTHQAIPGMQGAMPEGTVYLNGSIAKLPGGQPQPLTDPQQRAQWGISPADHNAYAVGPDGKVVKTADSPYGPKEIQSVHDNFFASDETKKATEGIAAYNGMVSLISKYAPNGIVDSASMDSFLRGINPGMGARNSTVNMVLNHIGGLSQLVREHILSHVDGNGYLTPDTLQHMVNVVHDYTQSHIAAAANRAGQDAQMVRPFGYNASDLAENLPNIPNPPPINAPGYVIPGGNGTPNPGASSGNRPNGVGGAGFSPAAIQAEIARRRASGQLK